ncbi:unnamed protein product, partial [Brassica rapa subsp. narinosa]
MEFNSLTGSIPPSFARLQYLQKLHLNNNYLGSFSPGNLEFLVALTNCSQLQIIYVGFNRLGGDLPASIVNFSMNLIHFDLEKNFISGSIPHDIGNLVGLQTFWLSKNLLKGTIPASFGKLRGLVELSVFANRMSGEIPYSLGNITRLEKLYLYNNGFEGSIPPNLGKCSLLLYLHMQNNKLNGVISEEIVRISTIVSLNLSNNLLTGSVPEDVGQLENHQGNSQRLWVTSASLCWLEQRKKKNTNEATPSTLGVFHEMISYGDLQNATDGFSSSNLIGSGSFGTVFKAFLPADNKVVAVKVLNMQRRGAMRSFMAECESLKDIRHRNLVKLLTACSSIDFQGNEFRALIYEYMPNGSLDMWLHPKETGDISRPSRTLTLLERLNIAIDVASETFVNQLSSAGVRGSIGYAAP